LEQAADSTKQKGGSPVKGTAARSAYVEEPPLHPMLQLQRQVGNQAVLAMLRSGALQAKLAVGGADDPAEKEADDVAERVMRKPSGAGATGACTCAAGGEMCEECRKKQLDVPGATPVIQRRAAGMSDAPAIVHQTLAGAGRPLDPATRANMEGRFGYDFGAVRIHADARAAESARSIDAFAYTVGNDIAFGEGQYAPQSEAGQRLLAHELTHVAQHDAAGGAIRRQPDPNAPATQAPAPVTPAPPAPEPQACLPDAQVCAPPSPQPGPAAKKPPQPAGTTIVFEGVQLAADSKFLYYQLEQMIVQKGEAATDAFAYRFINLTLENKIQLQLSGYDPSLIADIQVYLREEILRIEYDNKEFITLFQQKATDVTSEILDNSKTQIEKELQHYGITSTDIVSGETVSTIYSMSDKSAGKGLQAAAAVLAKKRREVNQAGNRALKSQSEVQKSAKDNPFLIPENLKGAAEQDRDAWLKQEDEYKDLRGVKEGLFPILATYSTGEDAVQHLERLAASPPGGVAQSIGEIADEKLKNIAVVRGELGKRFSIWKQQQIINITKKQLNATSMQSRIINDAAIKINEDKESSQKLFAAVAIGLGLLAAIPTGGSSLLVGIAAAATVVGAGLTVYGAYEHLQEFSLEQAASGTDFDKAKAISQDEPSMLWLALDIVAAVADIYGAAKAFKSLRAIMQEALAAKIAGKADEAAALLDKVEHEGNAVKPGLGDKLRQEIVGHAQYPGKFPWRPNPDGPRTIDEAVAIARKHGVNIPEDIQFAVSKTPLPANRFAEYAQLGSKSPDQIITWEEFYNKFEKIPVRLSGEVLNSDEAIVAVMGHEMYELNSLRQLFEDAGGQMKAGRLRELIREGVHGNLHDRAWDEADRLVSKMRTP
jgi:hypothetical protein